MPLTQTNDSDSDYDILETEIEEEIELDTDWETDDTDGTPIMIQKFSLSSIYNPEQKLDSDFLSVTNVPITYKEDISGQDRLKWIPAINNELVA